MKKTRIRRPRKIVFSFYDSFTDKWLGSFQHAWNPEDAANGWYSRWVRTFIKLLPRHVYDIPRDATFSMIIYR